MAVLAYADLPAPDIELYGFPEFGFGGAVGSVQHGVYNITIIKGFAGGAAFFHGVEYVREHMVIAQIIELITHRKEPAGITFGFLAYIVGAFAGGEHLQTGAQKAIDPDGAFGAHYFIAEVQA